MKMKQNFFEDFELGTSTKFGLVDEKGNVLLKQVIAPTNKKVDKRIDPRIPYSGHIFFTTKSGFFEGELTNYSQF